MYRVLYRKGRPRTFSEVSGQEHITSTLANEIMSGKISHAYLFTGSRGTGKTTCAKIFAKAINCLSPVNGSPCNECAVCKGIDDGSILDVIELDAASNNGVDNIRDIIEESNFTPVNTKFRVYIIDEVHMLSTGAFNALLKTLEEPPEHVKFILATTEVHKIPATILSRCQRFDFHRITPESIAKRVEYVADQENIEIDREAALLIARIADGALRDALSLLDRCSGTGERVTQETVSAAAGIAGIRSLFDLADCINRGDTAAALATVNTLHNESCDMERLCSELLNHYRNLMVVKTSDKPQELIICIDEDMELYKKQAQNISLQNILYCMSVLEDALIKLKNSINKRIETEMTVVRLCSPEQAGDYSALVKRIEKLEQALSSGFIQQKETKIVPKAEPAVPKAETAAKTEPSQEKSSVQSAPGEDIPFDKWSEVLSILQETDRPLTGILNGSAAFVRGEHILIKCDNPTFPQFIKTQAHSAALREAVFKAANQKYRLGIYRSKEPEEKAADPLAELIKKIN